jgi:hypothetical protein
MAAGIQQQVSARQQLQDAKDRCVHARHCGSAHMGLDHLLSLVKRLPLGTATSSQSKILYRGASLSSATTQLSARSRCNNA